MWPAWLALAVLTTLPYIVADLRAPRGYVFTGVLSAYDDTFSYFAWMRQSADGHLLMCDPFTSEPQSCQFFLPLWNLLGFVSGLTHLPIALTFHLARLMAAFILLAVALGVSRTVARSRTRLRYSVWMYAFSGGLGWVVYASNSGGDLYSASATGSADLNLPEAIAFRSMFAQVQFVAGAALVAAAIMLYFRALAEDRVDGALIAGGLVSVLAVVHPYLVVVAGAVALAASVAAPLCSADQGGKAWVTAGRRLLAFGAATVPGLTYLIYLRQSNQVLREWLKITDTWSPPPREYLLGFGFVGLLGVAGFWILLRRSAPGRRALYGRLLLLWTLVQTGLLYAPLSFQRRLVEGLQLPISIAASVAVFWATKPLFGHHNRARSRRLVLAGIIVFVSLTNLGFITGQLIARGPAATDPRRYLARDIVEALEWLRESAEPGSVLFSSYFSGNVAPAVTGLRVFLGHYGQTIDSDQKGREVTAFYSRQMSDEAARRLFIEHRVRYVMYGPFERTIAGDFVAPSWMELVHRVGDVEIYKVQLS